MHSLNSTNGFFVALLPIGSVLTDLGLFNIPLCYFGSVICLQGLFLFQIGHLTGGKELYWMLSASRKFSLLPQLRMDPSLLIYIYIKFYTQLKCLTQNHNILILTNILYRGLFF